MRARLALVAAAALLLAGCGASDAPKAAGADGTSSAKSHGTITVFAAASLKEAFTTLGQKFEQAHPGTHVVFSFAASSELAGQINAGAPADVFASASTRNMDQVVTAKHATSPTTFATNVMEIAVPKNNPAHVATISDLAKPGVKVALCQPQVPCGAAAQKVLRNAKTTVHPVTLEADVKATLTKVRLGEVDAGIVYVTDVRAAGDSVTGIPIATGINAATAYPIATLPGAPNPKGAEAFVQEVLSASGRQVLAADGFARP